MSVKYTRQPRTNERLTKTWRGETQEGTEMTTEQRQERDAMAGNRETFVRHLTRQIMQQNSSLLLTEAADEARKLYARGIRDLFN